MKDTIQIAIISAGLAALINCIFQLVNKLIDNAKERRENDSKKLNSYIEKKEEVYIAAIERLLQIRRGFDYTREMISRDDKIRATIDNDNVQFAKISPKLRLYSTDKIFNMYYQLAFFARFSYAPQNGPRLFENVKWAYDTQIILLSRLMQEDLGYRKLDAEHDMIVCPECTTQHDIISKCPKCGMTYCELQKRAQDILNQNQIDNTSEDTQG